MKSSIIGVFSAIILTTIALFEATPQTVVYVNLVAFLIVFGGTMSAAIITFGVKDLFKIFITSRKVFSGEQYTPKAMISQLIDVAVKINKNKESIGYLVTDKTLHPFLRDGLKFIYNDFDRDQIERILLSSLSEVKERYMRDVEILKTLSKYPL